MLALELILAVYAVLVLGFCVFFGYAAWKGCDPYPPEAAEAPSLDEHFKTAPRDEIEIDWHRYEYEMRKQT